MDRWKKETTSALGLVGALVLLWLSVPSQAAPLPVDVVRVPSSLETAPSTWSGDSIDDPAIWVNHAAPDQSLVVANNKKGALEVYDLSGALRQKITSPTGFWGNVDIRGDIVAASKNGILLYRVDPSRPDPLIPVGEAAGNAKTGGEGLCLYDPGAPGVEGGLYALNVQRFSSRVRMHPLTDGDQDGLLAVETHVKEFFVGLESEGCVADDSAGFLYVSEEDVGIWRYLLTDPGPGAPSRVLVDAVGPHLAPDIEGLALTGTYLIASAQNVVQAHASWFNVYDTTTMQLVRSVRVVDGIQSDDCDQTDGVAATSAYLGPQFPGGLFVCQDGYNQNPRQYQDLKLVPLEAVLP